jgi:hypothetical protein
VSILSGALPYRTRWVLLARLASAVDEALLFLWPDDVELPEYAFWTDEGLRARQERPERFTRSALTALRDELRSRVP